MGAEDSFIFVVLLLGNAAGVDYARVHDQCQYVAQINQN